MIRRSLTPFHSAANWALVLLALVITANAWHALVRYADWWPFLIDELVNTQAAVNFVRTGNYTSNFLTGPFPPSISTGIAATWPSALAWTIGSDMLTSRLLVGAATWALYLIAGWLFLRRQGFRAPLVLFLLAGAWSVCVASPVNVPNAPLFLINLGELVGVLWVALGLLLVRRSPYAAALTWGIAVWHCKFIYIPLVAGFGAVWLFTLPTRWPARVRCLIAFLACFLLPLIVWLGIISIQFGVSTALAWVPGLTSFVVAGGSGLSSAPQVAGLFERLNSPGLEWSTYASDWRAKILFLTLGAAGLTLGLMLFRPRLVADRMSRLFALVTAGCIALYAAWYFLWHPTMYIRHIQPALYLGLGLCLFWLLQIALKLAPAIKRFQWLWLGLAIFAAGLQTANTWQAAPLQSDVTYARACVDLFAPVCGDYTGLSVRIRSTPGAVVVRRGPPRERYPIFEQSYGPVDFVVPPDCSGQPASVMEEQMQQIADSHTEIWLLRSWPDKCDPADVIPRWLAEQAYPAEEFWLQTNLFSRYLIASGSALQGAQSGQLGESISLAGWSIDKDRLAPSQALNVSLTWVSPAPLAEDYRVFVFLADQAEQEAAHRDAVPVMWLRPTTTWQAGEPIVDHHALLIPPDARSGAYWLGVGMYDPATGERLPVTGGQGWMGNSALRLAAVTISATPE